MKLSELLFPDEYSSIYCAEDIEITSLSSDTSKIQRGCLFICVAGKKYDPHTALELIKDKGCAAVVVQRSAYVKECEGFPVFVCEDTRLMLAHIYSRFFGSASDEMKMIGVTGTNGKTSCSYMIYNILRECGHKVGLIGTVECRIGDRVFSLPDTDIREKHLTTMTTPSPEILYEILRNMADCGIEYVVMEVSSHALAMKRVAPIHFLCGVFTNLTPEHLDFHTDMDDYMNTKARLFLQCEHGVFNSDSEYASRIIRTATCKIHECSCNTQKEFFAKDVKLLGSHGVEYTLCNEGENYKVCSHIPAVFTVYNSLLSLAVTSVIGIDKENACRALQKMKSVFGRLERIGDEDENGYSVFIDYAHTEEALRSLLLSVRAFRRGGERIVLVFGCGGDRDRKKRAPMGRVAESLADFVIVTSDNSRSEDAHSIIKDILSGMPDVDRRRVITDRKKAIEYAIKNARQSDIIIIAGKGHETYQIDKTGYYSFDEREIVLRAQEMKRNGDTEI